MVYRKYKCENDAVGNLDAGINASTTTLTLNTGDGAVFPIVGASEYAIGTLVQYVTANDPTSGVAKKERVLITLRSTDTFTITRGQFGTTGTTFNAGDYFYINNVAQVITDIQDEVSRLETDKLDKSGGLRDTLTAWRLFYSNGSGDETALSFGTSGNVLQSNGASSAPTWVTPTVNINGLTASTTPLGTWYGIFYNGSANVKVLLSNLVKALSYATTSQAGVVELSTDAEALAGTDETRYINPKQAKDNYGTQILPSEDTIISGGDISTTTTSFTYVKRGEFTINKTGTYRAKASVITASGGGDNYSAEVAIYKNGVFIAEGTTGSGSGSGRIGEVTTDISVINNDTIEAYIKVNNSRTCRLNSFTLNGFLFYVEGIPVDTF